MEIDTAKNNDGQNNEQLRLKALAKYNILNTEAELDFDEIVQLAAHICETPIGLISFVDSDRQWFKSKVGISIDQTERSVAFCAHAILDPTQIMIVDDATKDSRFAENPLVKGDPNIVFYAGMPLVDQEGYALGTLCTIDTKPRKLSESQIKALKTLSKQVVNMLKQRFINAQLIEHQNSLTNSISYSCPYYLFMDKNNCILSFGVNYHKTIPEMEVGKSFSTYFNWTSVFNSGNLIDETSFHNKLIFFDTHDHKNKFKCTVKKTNDDTYFIFAVPVINTLFPIVNYKVNINNFPKHDYIAEYLFLQQSATKGLQDSQMLNQLILEKNKKLEEAKNTLIKVNSTLEERINTAVQKIKHLALFPEQNPNPVIEIDNNNAEVTYLNPVAKKLLNKDDKTDIAIIKSQLQINDDFMQLRKNDRLEIAINNQIYERNVFFNEQFNSIRFYLHDITQIKEKEKEEKLKIDLFRQKQVTLNSIRKLNDDLSLEEKFKAISKAVAQTINCDCCAIWLSNDSKSAIATSSVYITSQDAFIAGMEVKSETAPNYFKALAGKNPILANEALTHEATSELSNNYLKPLNVKSMLDIPLLQGEYYIGVLSCSFSEIQLEFTSDKIAFCTSVSDIIVLACETNGLRASQIELKVKNGLLKEKMEQIINMQSEIIEREKLATLGMLIAGIAHEINSPLGAIKASNEYLQRVLLDAFLETIKNITPAVMEAGFKLFDAGNKKIGATTTRDIRILQKEMKAKLELLLPDLENKHLYATTIMELGYKVIDNELMFYLNHAENKNIFLFVQYLIDITKSINTISLGVNRAGNLVKALNTFSHGNIDQEITTFKLHDSFVSIITLLWNKIKYNAHLENNIPEEIQITGSADELSQVWTNIINNALQASDSKCKIWIDYAANQENHIISISNNGPPIPAETIPKIFDAFFSTKKRGEGTGLGLNIVMKIIEKHNGTIACESNAQKTSFIINLPKRNRAT